MQGLMLAATDGNKEFETAPNGTHIAYCYGFVDLGLQLNNYDGSKKNRILYLFELCNEVMTNGKPFAVSMESGYSVAYKDRKRQIGFYPMSSLPKILAAWRGKPYAPGDVVDVKEPLGKLALITTSVKEGSSWVKVTSMTSVPKGMGPSNYTAFNPLVCFEMDNINQTEFDKLPKWIQTKILGSDTYKEMTSMTAQPSVSSVPDLVDDDLPF